MPLLLAAVKGAGHAELHPALPDPDLGDLERLGGRERERRPGDEVEAGAVRAALDLAHLGGRPVAWVQ